MDAQDRDRALDAALRDLERTDEPIQPMRALIAAVVLIGRWLVPARSTAEDVTMPGRRVTRFVDHQRWEQRMAARRADAGVTERRGASDGVSAARTLADLERDIRRSATDPSPALAMFGGARRDPPRPTVRDRIAGVVPAPMNDAERAIWQRDREDLVDVLTLRRDLCVTLGISPQSSDAEVRAAARTLAEDRRALLAEREDSEKTRSDALMEAARHRLELDRALGLRDGICNALGLRSNALDSAIIGAVKEAGEVLRVAREQIDAARKVLAVACNIGVDHDPPLTLSALVERAARRIAALLEEHQRERSMVDELRSDLRDSVGGANIIDGKLKQERADHEKTRREAVERWQRIQPLIKALHAWEDCCVLPLIPYDRALIDAFEAWQKAEADALDAEEAQPTPALCALFGGPPVDGPDPVGALADVPDEAPAAMPRQPNDPGVEPTTDRESHEVPVDGEDDPRDLMHTTAERAMAEDARPEVLRAVLIEALARWQSLVEVTTQCASWEEDEDGKRICEIRKLTEAP